MTLVAADLRAAIIVEDADPAERNQWPLGDRPLPLNTSGLAPGMLYFVGLRAAIRRNLVFKQDLNGH